MHLLKSYSVYCLALLMCWQSATVAYAQQAESEAELIKQLLRGHLLASEGQYRDAAVIVGDIGRLKEDGKIMASAVKFAIQSGDLDLAQEHAEAWVRFSDSIQAQQAQAELFLIAGQWRQAEALLSRLVSEKKQSMLDLYRQLSIITDDEKAVEMGQRVFPADASGRYHLSLLAFGKKMFPAAWAAAQQALEADSEARLDILFLAARLAQLVEGDKAPLPLLQAYVKRGCADNTKHCQIDAVLWAFSDYLRDGQQWRNALYMPRAEQADWAISAGHWYLQWEMLPAAKAAYERGGERFMARLGLSRLSENEGNLTLALEILQESAVEDRQEFVLRETGILQLLSELDDLTAALARAEQAQKTVPDNFSLMYHHSLLLERNDDISAALEVLERLTVLFPENANAWNALGYVMADHNIRLQEAKKYIERALQIQADDPNIIDSLGWVYYRLGDLPKAQAQLEKAAALTDSVEIHAHYGEILWENGEIERAKEVWRQAQQLDSENEILKETLARYRIF